MEKKRIKYLFLLIITGIFLGGGAIGENLYQQEKGIQADFWLEGTGGERLDTQEAGYGKYLMVSFSRPINTASSTFTLEITPTIGLKGRWLNQRQLRLKILNHLNPRQDYQLTLRGLKSRWGVSLKDFQFSFSAPMPPQLVDFYPATGQQEVDSYEKIKIRLSRPLGKDYYISFRANPSLTDLKYSLSADEKEIILAASAGFKKSTTYQITVILKNRFQKDFKEELYHGQFTVRRPPPIVYSLNSDGTAVKFEERKEEIAPQIKVGKYIDIDLSSQALFIFQDGKELGAYKISSGKRGLETPSGTFQVIAKSPRPWSDKYKLFMPWFIQFTHQGHGIHELPEWPGGYKEGTNHLGIPVSHGCVRLGVGPAKIVYDFAEPGMPIIIHQ